MNIQNAYTYNHKYRVDPDILSTLGVNKDGDVVSASAWTSLWQLVLAQTNHFDDTFTDMCTTMQGVINDVRDAAVDVEDAASAANASATTASNAASAANASATTASNAASTATNAANTATQKAEAILQHMYHIGYDAPTNEDVAIWIEPGATQYYNLTDADKTDIAQAAGSEAIATVMDTAPFNTATGNTYANFVEKYQLKQNKWVDLSFVGNPKYYSSFTTAVSDINAGIRTNGADVVANAVAVTFVANGITVLRLLKNIELTATLAFTESVILDLYEYNLTYTGTINYCLTTNTTMAFILYSNHKTFGGSVETSSALYAQATYCGIFNTTIKVIQTTYDLTTSALRIKNSKFDVYNCNLSVVDTSPNKATSCSDLGLNSNTSSGIVYNTHISVDGMVNVSGIYVVEHNVAQKIYFLNSSIDAITHSTTTAMCVGIMPYWASTDRTNPSTLVIDNCDIRAYSNDYGDGSAIGIANGFITYMSNSCCTGVTSGVQNNQTIYMYKCMCASPYHGGLYNATNGTAYLTDTVFSFSDCPTGYILSAAGSAYFGYGSRAFLDGCTFINKYPVLRGAGNPIGEHTEASFSNCEFYNNQIRVDDEQIAFVGEGCPTLTNIRTPNPGTITVTTATYRYGTPNIQTSDDVITANQLLTANVINDIADGQYIKVDSVDQAYSSTSTNTQSGTAVAQALQNQYQNNLTTPATVTDSNGSTLSNVAVVGKSIQDGTPTPTAPIEIQNTGNSLSLVSCGKNLIPKAYKTTYTYSGLTIDFDNDTQIYTLNGTTTQTVSFSLVKFLVSTTISDKYSMSVKYISGSVSIPDGKNAMIYFRQSNDGETRTDWQLLSNLTTVDVEKENQVCNNKYINNMCFFANGSVSFTNYKCQVQLQTGSTATSYELYSGNTYTIPLTDINGTSHIMRQYDEVKKVNGVWKYIQNSGYVESYDSTVNTDVTEDNLIYCTTGELSTGASVVYKLSTPIEFELSTSTSAILDNIAIQKGNANIYFTNAVAPIMTADYPLDMKLYVDNKMSALEARLTALENIQ